MDTSTASDHTATDERTANKNLADARKHDVRFTTSARQSLMYTANRGVTLTPDAITWTFDGKPDGAPFKNIVDVCVQKGPGGLRFVRVCHITFADRFKLLVTDGNEFAIPTEAQRAAYRGFMHDLHARLVTHAAGRDGPPIAFRAGFAAKLHRWLKIRVTLSILVFVGAPLAGFLMTGDVKPFLLLVGALVVGALFWRMVQSNAPLTYDPRKPPRELIE
jgi:hypothetical protein